MGDSDPADVLWFGAFETTAFLTAVLVGAYSFIQVRADCSRVGGSCSRR